MSRLFSSLRRQHHHLPADDKDSDSDEQQQAQTAQRSSPTSSPSASPLFSCEHNKIAGSGETASSKAAAFFSLRIKLNDGPMDFTLDGISPSVTTVKVLKERIMSHSNEDGSGGAAETSNINRYLRLIVRGRMMAPDTSTLDKFSISSNDVIHAVLAKEGIRGGQQARMLRRLNKSSSTAASLTASSNNNHNGGDDVAVLATRSGRTNYNHNNSAGGETSGGASAPTNTNNNYSLSNRLLRRIGIDSNGIILGNHSNENDDDTDDESDDDTDDEELLLLEEAEGRDLEMGNITRPAITTTPRRRRGQRERRQRERRGFDRLRSTGMSREEITAIRLYFARSIDRYIERRRTMIRASRLLRDSSPSTITNSEGGGGISSPSTTTSSGDEETGRLLPSAPVVTASTITSGSADITTTTTNSSNNTNNVDDEEILTDRRRMEDEWMSTQGPYSEFRLNLNTSNPLLLAAISGGAANVAEDVAATMRLNAALGISNINNNNGVGRGGLFFRRAAAAVNAAAVALEVDDEEEEEEEEEDDLMFGGTLNPNGTYVPRAGIHPMYMGPLPSAGTEKDFVWGFILGFFVGFIMLFWVWMPSVTHKQKVGIILGICFQLGMNLILKNNGHGHI